MNNDPLEHRAALLPSKVAADAAAEVQAAFVSHAACMGRSGIVVRLRAQARELATSAIGYNQISSLAFEAADDDMAWGARHSRRGDLSRSARWARRSWRGARSAPVCCRSKRRWCLGASRLREPSSIRGTMHLTRYADTPPRSKPMPRSNRRCGTIHASPPRQMSV
jgi:hypothetical protein